jgi:hypothetical protein
MGFREKEAAETNRSRINGSFNWLLISDYLLLNLTGIADRWSLREFKRGKEDG